MAAKLWKEQQKSFGNNVKYSYFIDGKYFLRNERLKGPYCSKKIIDINKQRYWTVLSELRYKVAYNPNTFFRNWKQRTTGKAVEDALQYIKMYVAGVWTTTAKGYFKNVEEQVIRRQSKFWSNL